MTGVKKNIILLISQFIVLFSMAQEGTRTTKNTPVAADAGRKIMIIPFEPKLYMSDIDMKINEQTKWKFEKIRENFRQQLNTQLKLNLQSIAPVVSFYSDSVKMAKDLSYIYRSTSLSYDLISNPNEVKAPATKHNGIKNGQLVVEVNLDKKFMNTKINDSKLLSYLNTKYKTEYFVFINQFDIKNNLDTYDIATDIYQREITVHYSILDKTGKNISAGIATSNFSSKENEPKRIALQNFPPISSYIATKLASSLKPELSTIQKK
jgi:hypothetical protein